MSFPFLLRLCIGEDEVDSDFTLANLGRSTFGRRTSKFWDSTDFKRMMSSRENILTPEDSILVCKLHFLALSSVRAIYRCSDIGQMVRRSKVPSYKNITAKMEIPLTEFQFILDLVSHVQYVQVDTPIILITFTQENLQGGGRQYSHKRFSYSKLELCRDQPADDL